MDVTGAITILQCNERGRQGRLRAKFMKEIRDQEERERRVLAEGQVESDLHQSATKIQKHFKGFLARKKCRELRQQELEFLGMEFPAVDRSAKEKERLDMILHRRKLAQQQNQHQLEADRANLRQEIKDQEGGRIMEEFHDELLEQIIKLKSTGDERWHEFPSIEDGGSANPEWMAIRTEPSLEELAMQQENSKSAGKDSKKGRKEAKKKEGKKGKKKGDDEGETKIEVIPPSKFWPKLHEGTDRYVAVWQDRFEPTDFLQKYDKDLLRSEIMEGTGGLEAELRSYVDALVRVEIHNLQIGLMTGGAKKSGKGKNKGKGKGKKEKGKSKGGGKNDQSDKVKAQDVYNLCRELYWIKFLPKIPDVKISDYIGAHNLMGKVEEDANQMQTGQVEEISKKWAELLERWASDPDQAKAIERSICMKREEFQALFEEWKKGNPSTSSGVLFEPSMAQVRQAVSEYCVLPLGSQTIHDLVDPHGSEDQKKAEKPAKKGSSQSNGMTVLFYGASLSGKTMLSHAIANETGSLFFDMTPTGPAFQDGRYCAPNPIRILLAMVFKVARAWAPAVIYIDQVDTVFTKRKGKNRNIELEKVVKPLKKELFTNMKTLEPTDRVMVIGNCHITEDVLKAQEV